jgi:hypothetical protein
VILLGFMLPLWFYKSLTKREIIIFRVLWIYHLSFSIFYFFYTKTNSADAVNYWRTPKTISLEECINYPVYGFGTKTMFIINYFPSNVLELSFLTGNILYSILGFIGFIFFYKLVKSRVKEIPTLFGFSILTIIIYFPNFHFWTANAGKDTLLFFSISIILYFLQKEKLNLLYVIIGVLITGFIRPHITAIILIAYSLAFLMDKGLKKHHKILLVASVLVIFALIFDQVMSFLSLDNVSVNSVLEYSKQRVEYLSGNKTGSSVDMNSYPLPFKIFTFLYRPLFIDSPNALGLVSSLENVVLILISVKVFYRGVVGNFRNANYTIKASFYFFVIGTLMFSLTMGNLGVMLRMKNMLLPSFVLFACYLISWRQNKIPVS